MEGGLQLAGRPSSFFKRRVAVVFMSKLTAEGVGPTDREMPCTGRTFIATDSDATALCSGLIAAGRLWTVHWHKGQWHCALAHESHKEQWHCAL
jgi:hypothetical protein